MPLLRSCWWWLGTIGLILFLIGLSLVYPWLLVPTILIGIVYFIYIVKRRSNQ
jgi:hypothetical protein